MIGVVPGDVGLMDVPTPSPSPHWADAALAAALPAMVARGECESVEFKREFPAQADDLAKEIAAFATSRSGTVLLGVSDDGLIVGLAGMESADARDAFVRRIEGVCNSIRPAVTPVIRLTQVDGRCVAAIEVPRGPQAVYYVQYRPYTRHVRSARPAEPHEVVELVTAWAEAGGRLPPKPPDPLVEFCSDLYQVLVEARIQLESFADRRVDPWVSAIKAELRAASGQLRQLALTPAAELSGAKGDLERLADALDQIVYAREHLGSGPEREKNVRTALDLADEIRSRYLPDPTATEARKEQLRQLAVDGGKVLEQLTAGLDTMARQHRWDEIQRKAGGVGLHFITIAAPGQGLGGEAGRAALHELGRKLRSIEAITLRSGDGERILAGVRTASAEFGALLPLLSAPDAV